MHIIELECPICFEFVDNSNDTFFLNCCKKKVHKSCLLSWYNINNYNNLSCFLCTQSNNDINNLLIKPILINNNTVYFFKIIDYIIIIFILSISFIFLFILLY